MDLEFLLKASFKTLLLPPAGPLMAAAVGLALSRRAPVLGRGLAWAGLGALFALSLPVVAAGLVALLADSGPVDLSAAASAGAIVVIGGGVRADAEEYGGDTLGRLSLERVRYGAKLARELRLPMLVTGGGRPGRAREAMLMARALDDEYGIGVAWTETRSRNTRENAENSQHLLRGTGVRRVVLVAHGFDMRRARIEFERTGLEVVSAPTQSDSGAGFGVSDYVPGPAAMQESYYACYELAANSWLALRRAFGQR